MARTINRLTARTAVTLTRPGLYADGGGLYLQVAEGGSRSWIFRYRANGKRHDMGLGSARSVSLALVRAQATEFRRQLQAGESPLAAREAAKVARGRAILSMTFDQATAAYIAAHEPSWRNAKHRAQWRSTMARHVSPVIGHLPIREIRTDAVLSVLEPIWQKTPETAKRVRGRIETVLDWAKARGLRDGDNPARWRGHLSSLLPPRSKLRAVKHFAAMPLPDLPNFMVRVRANDSVSARALEFLMLTAARTGEVLGARWDEVDWRSKTWIIPASRMKSSRDHRVPLSRSAEAILSELRKVRVGEFVFPGQSGTAPLSSMALLMLLRRLGRADTTVHGFRSTFRDWAAEQTDYPREVAEAALAHVVGDRVEAAYRRGDLLQKRRQMLEDWAQACCRNGRKPRKQASLR